MEGSDLFIVAGDLNAKHILWHSSLANAMGSVLYQYVQQADFTLVALVTPTFFPSNRSHRPDKLHIALIKSSNKNDLNF